MALIRGILEQHDADARSPGSTAAVRAVRPDLLLADRESAAAPFGLLAASKGGRAALDCVLARDLPAASAWSSGSPASDDLLRTATACGAWIAPPGAGDRTALALDALAAPGRLFATLGACPEAGALGALALPVGEMEALALLLGEPLEIEARSRTRVELAGELPPRCDGHDVAGSLIAAHPGAIPGAWIEVGGAGVAALGMSDRVALCRALGAAGATAVVFPCDERAREFLRARGREPDWRHTEAGPAEGVSWDFDLGWTVPHAISAADPMRAVPLAWWAGVDVAAVAAGPGLPLETLAWFVALMRGRSADASVALSVTAWSERAATSPEAAELAARFVAAGARWVREGELAPWIKRAGRLRLSCGELPASGGADADDWTVGVPAAVEAACRGRIDPPHTWPDPREIEPPAGPVIPPATPPAARAPAAAGGTRSGRAMAPRPGSAGLRGPVLGRVEGDLEPEGLLPMGPRLADLLARPELLAAHVVPGARRAAGEATGPVHRWLLVLGEVRGLERREVGLLGLRSLGVRGVLAAGIEPRSRSLLAHAGLLALRVLRAADLEAVEVGDELELVGGIDGYAPDRARVVRDLTRGFTMVALPELTAGEWQRVAAGGVLAIGA